MEYKITKVSDQPPRTWDGPNGTVYYVKVSLDGHDKPVEIGKKNPDALSVGMTVNGTIKPTDYPADSFKAESTFGGGGGGGFSKNSPATNASIEWQNSLSNATKATRDYFEVSGTKPKDWTDYLSTVESAAVWFHKVVETKPEPEQPAEEPKVETKVESKDDEINIDEIPF